MNQLDPINVAIVIASVILGEALAEVIGPYTVILIAATVGTAWSLGRRSPSSKFNAFGYFALMVSTAALVTVSTANAIGNWLGHTDTSWMLAPIAMLIGGIGGDWPRLLVWSFKRALQIFERRNGGGV